LLRDGRVRRQTSDPTPAEDFYHRRDDEEANVDDEELARQWKEDDREWNPVEEMERKEK